MQIRQALYRATATHVRHSPAGRLSWLSPAPQAEQLLWPFSRRVTLMLLVFLALLVGIGLLMIFPTLPANGIVWLIYAAHDTVVLPLRGRIFERYAPVPQVVLGFIAFSAVTAFFARNVGRAIYNRVASFWMGRLVLRRLMTKWLRLSRRDGHLWAALEAEYRRATENWLMERTSALSKNVLEQGRFMLGLPWAGKDHPLHDVALASIAVRHAVVLSVYSEADNADLSATLRRLGGGLSASLAPLFDADLTYHKAEATLEAAWQYSLRRPEAFGDLAREVIVWAAWWTSVDQGDAAFARRYQARMAKLAFTRDLQPTRNEAANYLIFEPGLWSMGGAPDARAAQPGLGLAPDALGAMRDRLREGAEP